MLRARLPGRRSLCIALLIFCACGSRAVGEPDDRGAPQTATAGVGPLAPGLRKKLRLHAFYQQHLDVQGFPILGSKRVYWLDHVGARRSYGEVPPEQNREQTSLVGHVWVVTDMQGRELGRFVATAKAGRARIRRRDVE